MKSGIETLSRIDLGEFTYCESGGQITFRYRLMVLGLTPWVEIMGLVFNDGFKPINAGKVIRQEGKEAFGKALAEARRRYNAIREPQPWAR